MKEGKGLVNTQQHLQQLYFATALNQLKAAELLTFACLDFKHIGCPKIYTYDLQMSELYRYYVIRVRRGGVVKPLLMHADIAEDAICCLLYIGRQDKFKKIFLLMVFYTR